MCLFSSRDWVEKRTFEVSTPKRGSRVENHKTCNRTPARRMRSMERCLSGRACFLPARLKAIFIKIYHREKARRLLPTGVSRVAFARAGCSLRVWIYFVRSLPYGTDLQKPVDMLIMARLALLLGGVGQSWLQTWRKQDPWASWFSVEEGTCHCPLIGEDRGRGRNRHTDALRTRFNWEVCTFTSFSNEMKPVFPLEVHTREVSQVSARGGAHGRGQVYTASSGLPAPRATASLERVGLCAPRAPDHVRRSLRERPAHHLATAWMRKTPGDPRAPTGLRSPPATP